MGSNRHLNAVCCCWSTPQTFQHEGVPRASYVQFFWYTEEAGDGNYLHPVPAQALIGAKGTTPVLSALCMLYVVVRPAIDRVRLGHWTVMR